jgi:hypothetical protein
VSESWSTSSLTEGFLRPGSDTPHLHQTVTNPSQTGWNQLKIRYVIEQVIANFKTQDS